MQEKGAVIMELLWQPGQIGPMHTKNRTIRSATNEHLATRSGELTQAWMDAYEELARGGVGVIITGQFAMDASQRADEGQPILVEEMEPGMFSRSRAILRRTAEAVHRHGAKLVVQLSHTGSKATAAVNGHGPKGPADFDSAELDKLVKAFTFAAKTCADCGVDGVQIHMAHGYLLSGFLHPEQNTRTDEYGGSLENRYRLSGRIIRAVREACGDSLALMVKIDSNCCGDLRGLLKLCEKSGVDCAEVSGLDFAGRKRGEEPFYLRELTRAREGIALPVSIVGGVAGIETARKALEAGVEFVSLSRALICEPDLIRKFQSGEQSTAACVGCNQCFKIFRQRPLRCVMHRQPIRQLEAVFGPYPEK